MKTEEEQNHKLCQSPMLPRVILKPNSQSGQRQRRLLNSRHTSICSPHNKQESQRNGQKVDSAIRESVSTAGLEEDREISHVQRKVEGVDHRHGQYGDLGALRNLFQETMLRLCFVMGNWHCLQSIWKMSKTFAKDQTVGQEEL